MALITRCPHCTTAFRVTPLHLQAHGGDVRCGRCAQVFNAFSTLSTIQEPEAGDLAKGRAEGASGDTRHGWPAHGSAVPAVPDQEKPSPAPGHEVTQSEVRAEVRNEARVDMATPEAIAPETTVAETVPEEAVVQEMPVPETPLSEASIPEAPIPETATPEAGGAGMSTMDMPLQGRPASESAPAERLAEVPDGIAEPPYGPATDTTDADKASASEKIYLPGVSEPETRVNDTHVAETPAQQVHAKGPAQELGPRETRQAHEHEFQAENYAFDAVQPRQTSAAWTFANLLLLILLTGQTVYFYRAELATLVPAAKPYLEQYCQLLQCTVSLPRHSQLLNIESSDMHADPR
ncbi:MAG: zinc-ribbon domain-containing protein, partial [Betaproteobacteria bacterium]|nr:zinc-ribbon domain-containing protein [Betaproteobacteria bacterium]